MIAATISKMLADAANKMDLNSLSPMAPDCAKTVNCPYYGLRGLPPFVIDAILPSTFFTTSAGSGA